MCFASVVAAETPLGTGCKEETKFHVGGRNGGGILGDAACMMLWDKAVSADDIQAARDCNLRKHLDTPLT